MRQTHSYVWRTKVEPFRVRHGLFCTDSNAGRNGMFIIGHLSVVCSDGMGWEHVSVSRQDSIPIWDEMCHIKYLFWDDEEWVVQFHPAKSEYKNLHPYCLHLWKPIGVDFPKPLSVMVAP